MIHPNVFVFNFLILLISGWVVAASLMAEKTNVGMAVLKPAPRRVFWNPTILHTTDMTQPSQSALSKLSVHSGKTSTGRVRAQDNTSALVTLFCQHITRIRRMLLRWNVLSLLSCPACVVHVSLPYSNVLITQEL